MEGFEHKVAIVTGAASGIGRGILERFVEAGASVAAVDVDAALLRAAVAALPLTDRALAIEADVRDEAQVRSAVEQCVARFGRLDVLVNNAGIELSSSVPDMPAAEWDRQLDVNLKGAFLFSKYSIPCMRAQGGGVILNIASVHAFVSYPGAAAYDASKSGLLGLTRAMALDHGRDGIRVNAVCPGYIDTPIMERWLETVPDREEALRQVVACHPGGRIGTPRDIANACLFLASGEASFISGTHLVVDGAMIAAGH
jgi:NAD(P)-dependent dehydrogenase (short-subunit alcohol dehydrogenase family)